MKRAFILMAVAACLVACHKRQPPPVVGRAAPPPASVVALDTATRDFSAGAYGPALRSFEEYLKLTPTGGHRDEALFHLGLIYALPGESRQDWQRASNYFTQLTMEFPSSPLRPAAELILTLRKETTQLTAESQQRDQRIRQLNTELDRLIRIDSERRGR